MYIFAGLFWNFNFQLSNPHYCPLLYCNLQCIKILSWNKINNRLITQADTDFSKLQISKQIGIIFERNRAVFGDIYLFFEIQISFLQELQTHNRLDLLLGKEEKTRESIIFLKLIQFSKNVSIPPKTDPFIQKRSKNK